MSRIGKKVIAVPKGVKIDVKPGVVDVQGPKGKLTQTLPPGIGFELGKRGFAAWLLKVPTYKTVYGAFAVVPAFLLWTYFSWLVTLSAALVAANLARLRRRSAKQA